MTTEADRQAVADVLRQFARAIHDKDAGALDALHDPDARIFDLAPPLGKGFAAPPLIEWLESWEKPVTETWADHEIEVSGDLAICHGYVRTETARGGEEAAWWMRRTVCLKRVDGRWRIVHDHASVPFYMDGSDRPALDLAPPRGDTAQSPADR
jgi:ketosteroid isomerase-like protein